MNRIQNLVDDELSTSLLSTAGAGTGLLEPEAELRDAHCIFTPMHYERNYAYPLIVWLHGPNADEHQVSQVLPGISLRNYVGVAPRGTAEALQAPGMFRWSQGQRHVAEAEQRVFSAVAAARRWLNIAPSRIYLAGFQCGGTMALRVALNHPDVFAGVLSLGGAFPSTLRPLGQLHAARRLRTFLAVGQESRLYPDERVCEDLRLFHAAGMSLHLRLYPCGDEVLSNMLSDMDRWIMEQVVPSEPVEREEPDYRLGSK